VLYLKLVHLEAALMMLCAIVKGTDAYNNF